MIEYGPSILEEYFSEQENIKNVLEKHTIKWNEIKNGRLNDWNIYNNTN